MATGLERGEPQSNPQGTSVLRDQDKRVGCWGGAAYCTGE